MNDSTYLMMVYFSKKKDNKQINNAPKRRHSKVNFNNKVFIEDEMKKPEVNENELKGILKKTRNNNNWFFIF